MRCVGGVLSQRVTACRVETMLRGWWAPPIELVGCVSVWVGGSSSRHGDDDSCLFVRAFVRSIRSGGSLPHTNYVSIRFVCVFVCVRAFAPYLPPYLPGLGTNALTGVCVCDRQAVTLDLDHHDYDDLLWVRWVVRMRG